MTRTVKFCAFSACMLGLALGYGLRSHSPESGLALSPSTLHIPDGLIEGEDVEVEFELINLSDSAVDVESVTGSCGCMAITSESAPLETPLTLRAGESLPIGLSISTIGRVGPQSFSIFATAKRDGRLVQGTVHARLLGTLRAQPSMVIFRRAAPNAPVVAEIELADMLPGAGVRIREVVSSDPEHLRVELVPRSGPSTIFGQSVDAYRRASLKIEFTPNVSEGEIHNEITVVPESNSFPKLRVPVYCELADAPYRFIPDGLTLTANTSAQFRRTVIFQSDDRETNLAIEEVPPDIHVTVDQRMEKVWHVTISGTLTRLKDRGIHLVFNVDGHLVDFPIRRLE